MLKHFTLSGLFMILIVAIGFSQTSHQISVGGGANSFSPNTLTIAQGDDVTWTNAGGFHNVNCTSGPVTFTNGAASSSAWTYNHVFTMPGTYNYQCDPHAGGGMTGTITVTSAPTPLSGPYTIGGTGADYATFTAAVADLTTLGISGAVTFTVAAGTYTESITIPAITGSSMTNTITFDGVDTASVTITDDGTTQNSIILLDGVDYLTIKNIKIENTKNVNDAWGIQLMNRSDFVTIDHCAVSMAHLTAYADIVGVVSSASTTASATGGDNAHNLTVSNTTITGGYHGIRHEGGNSSTPELDSNLVFSNNILVNNIGAGFFLDDLINLTISDNQVYGLGLSSKDGIDLSDVINFYVTGNNVHVPDYGIELDDGNYSIDGVLATGRSTIINNMLYSEGEDAINLDDAEEIDVFHNTCVSAALTSGRRALRFNDDVNLVIKNNIFVGSINEAVWVADATSNAVMDYNSYYTTGPDLANVGGVGYPNLTSWQTGTPSNNANSVFGLPIFVSPTDLHINVTDGLVSDIGDNTVGVTTDIDGDMRPLSPSTTVDMGADEYVAMLPTGPQVEFSGNSATFDEATGTITVDVTIINPTVAATTVEVSLEASSTATSGTDFTFTSPTVLTFPSGSMMNQQVSIPIIDDAMIESTETIVLKLGNTTNSATIGIDTTYTISITDNDYVLTNDLILTGVYDGTYSGGFPKGVELYVVNNIADLSKFGIGSANNGGGTDGQEYTFPAVSATAGDFIYLTNDTAQFATFFGISATFQDNTGAVNVNGDDALELFEDGQLIDYYGDRDVDGNGTPWEYLDAWAYRKCATGPDTTFSVGDWILGPVNIFDGVANNAGAASPMPIGSYNTVCPMNPVADDDNVSTDMNMAVTIDVLANDNTPNTLDSIVITSMPMNGMVMVNGVMDITYTPNMGFCGSNDMFEYAICDLTGCDTATVTITVNCPISYPYYPIADVHTEDMNGVADSLGNTYELRGVVYGIDFDGNAGLSFTIIDHTGGINVFNFNDVGTYSVTEGDSIRVFGEIEQYRGLTEIVPDSIILVSQGNTLKDPTIVTALGEDTESDLIQLEGLTIVDPTQWPATGNSANVDVTNGVDTFAMRIDSDTDVTGTFASAPTFTFRLTGIGGQFDTSDPYTSGYQIFPRYFQDITNTTSTKNVNWANEIKLFPNPTSHTLNIESQVALTSIRISNVLGQEIQTISNPQQNERVDVSSFTDGVYIITFMNESNTWSTQVLVRK